MLSRTFVRSDLNWLYNKRTMKFYYGLSGNEREDDLCSFVVKNNEKINQASLAYVKFYVVKSLNFDLVD